MERPEEARADTVPHSAPATAVTVTAAGSRGAQSVPMVLKNSVAYKGTSLPWEGRGPCPKGEAASWV